ncbi:hypothetical protein JCM19235_3168 [Vibrio maritimus]|uniref:Uncharacterized protein n=1 Tax=Vibrio maritimus TaxID=990268 RepID=A0A090S720_9VIBR|nr:hypothetical protein JCM19235_3168 [Vibrio maritimus]
MSVSHWLLWLVIGLLCIWHTQSDAKPAQSDVAPHIATLKPYQNHIIKKFEEFSHWWMRYSSSLNKNRYQTV